MHQAQLQDRADLSFTCVLGVPAAVVVVAVDLPMQLGQLRMVAVPGVFPAAREPVAMAGGADKSVREQLRINVAIIWRV